MTLVYPSLCNKRRKLPLNLHAVQVMAHRRRTFKLSMSTASNLRGRNQEGGGIDHEVIGKEGTIRMLMFRKTWLHLSFPNRNQLLSKINLPCHLIIAVGLKDAGIIETKGVRVSRKCKMRLRTKDLQNLTMLIQ